MATRIGSAIGQLTATTATTDLTISGETRTPTGCVVYCSYGTALDANIDDAGLSVGYSDFTTQVTHTANAEDAQTTSDTAAESNTGVVLAIMTPGTHAIIRSATVVAISGGIRLTPVQSGAQYRVVAIFVFEAECVTLDTGDGTRTKDVEFNFAHTLAGEPNFGWVSHANSDFGVGTAPARLSLGVFSNESDTIVVRSIGHCFENGNAVDAECHAHLRTDRIVTITSQTSGSVSIAAELTAIDGTNFSMTPRNNPLQSPVIGLLCFASDVTAIALSVDSPTTAASDWNYNGASLTGQHLTLYMSMIRDENLSKTDDAQAGAYGVHVTDGTDDFSVIMTNQNAATPNNTKSRVSTKLHLRSDGGGTMHEMTNFSFTSDGWDVAAADITTANATIRKWIGLLLSEASGGAEGAAMYHHLRNIGAY